MHDRYATDESSSRAAPVAWVTYTLLAVNVLLFAAMWKVGNGNVETVLTAFGSKNNALIRDGHQYWRFVTPIFLHGSPTHLMMNSLSMLMLCAPMEQIYGARKYFLVYMTAGIVSFLASYLSTPAASVGASGAIFGMVGAGLVFPMRYRSLVPQQARTQILSQLLIVAAINLSLGFWPGSHIDNYAHMGGLIGGAFAALFLLPDALLPEDWEESPRSRLSSLGVSAGVAATLVVIGWAAYRQWNQWKQETTPPPMVTYAPPGIDPWWSVGIPKDWKQETGRWAWRSPQGAMARIMDSARDTREVAQVVLSLKGRQGRLISLDGKIAYHFAWKSAKGVTELFVAQPYDRVLLLMLECPERVCQAAQRDFAFIVRSVRFVHPPNDVAAPAALPGVTFPALPSAASPSEPGR